MASPVRAPHPPSLSRSSSLEELGVSPAKMVCSGGRSPSSFTPSAAAQQGRILLLTLKNELEKGTRAFKGQDVDQSGLVKQMRDLIQAFRGGAVPSGILPPRLSESNLQLLELSGVGSSPEKSNRQFYRVFHQEPGPDPAVPAGFPSSSPVSSVNSAQGLRAPYPPSQAPSALTTVFLPEGVVLGEGDPTQRVLSGLEMENRMKTAQEEQRGYFSLQQVQLAIREKMARMQLESEERAFQKGLYYQLLSAQDSERSKILAAMPEGQVKETLLEAQRANMQQRSETRTEEENERSGIEQEQLEAFRRLFQENVTISRRQRDSVHDKIVTGMLQSGSPGLDLKNLVRQEDLTKALEMYPLPVKEESQQKK